MYEYKRISVVLKKEELLTVNLILILIKCFNDRFLFLKVQWYLG